jgi:hypothetical protein
MDYKFIPTSDMMEHEFIPTPEMKIAELLERVKRIEKMLEKLTGSSFSSSAKYNPVSGKVESEEE